jgi:hypothetical protein
MIGLAVDWATIIGAVAGIGMALGELHRMLRERTKLRASHETHPDRKVQLSRPKRHHKPAHPPAQTMPRRAPKRSGPPGRARRGSKASRSGNRRRRRPPTVR